MVNNNFFNNTSSYSLSELCLIGDCTLKNSKSSKIVLNDVAPLNIATKNDISFLDNPKYQELFTKTSAGAVIISQENFDKLGSGNNTHILISQNPYASYAKIAAHFYPQTSNGKIHKSATIGENVTIGNNVQINANTVIDDNVEIGDNTIIHSNCSISHSIIGNNVIIHQGSSIGQDGFGFAFDNGIHRKVPQLGCVLIEDHVEIGANCTIDRGAASDTIIGKGTKIDNLVQIAHNVKIGKYCIIVALCGISGSTELGDYCVIGGQTGIAGHLKIGNNVKTAAQTGVMKNIPDGQIHGGAPSMPIKDFHRQTIALKRLTKT